MDDLHKTLGKFTKGKGKLDLILSNQRASYNKNNLGHKTNRSLVISTIIGKYLILFSNSISVIKLVICDEYVTPNTIEGGKGELLSAEIRD